MGGLVQKARWGCRWNSFRPDIGDSHPSSAQYATLEKGLRGAWFAHGWNHWEVIYTPYLPSPGVTGTFAQN